MASKMPRTGGKHDGTVESYAKMRGARGKLCKSATSLKTTLFHPECEVFAWRGSPNIPKKIMVQLWYAICSLKVALAPLHGLLCM